MASHRTQVLLSEGTNSQVEALAKKNKRSMSAMCSELIEYALIHQTGSTDFSEQGVPLDESTLRRLKKLIKLLDSLD